MDGSKIITQETGSGKSFGGGDCVGCTSFPEMTSTVSKVVTVTSCSAGQCTDIPVTTGQYLETVTADNTVSVSTTHAPLSGTSQVLGLATKLVPSFLDGISKSRSLEPESTTAQASMEIELVSLSTSVFHTTATSITTSSPSNSVHATYTPVIITGGSTTINSSILLIFVSVFTYFFI